jgi:ubiquitin-like 1-activating enzyme E1 B
MELTSADGEAVPIVDGSTTSPAEPQRPQQNQTQAASSETALPRRSHIDPRDRFNSQSLGASLNTSVKQVRFSHPR